jgi:hypothetical protein
MQAFQKVHGNKSWNAPGGFEHQGVKKINGVLKLPLADDPFGNNPKLEPTTLDEVPTGYNQFGKSRNVV